MHLRSSGVAQVDICEGGHQKMQKKKPWGNATTRTTCGPWSSSTGWWLQNFFIFTPKIGEDEPILTSIFFKWVGSTTN